VVTHAHGTARAARLDPNWVAVPVLSLTGFDLSRLALWGPSD
jgi:hypothetical protein